ncbi:MAG: hypothetical protein R6U37_04900 [Dehalococcoidia bacterium]
MYLPLGTFSPEVKIGFVSASRDCFPRSLSEERSARLLAETEKLGLSLVVPKGECRIIETRAHAAEAARQLNAAECDATVLFLGNFSPEIEDAGFLKAFNGPVAVMAAAEESSQGLKEDRGDALCGLLSATLAIRRRNLFERVYLPQDPIVTAESGAREIERFFKVMKVVKGIRAATVGLFGPRPRDFETCNYNLASIASLGVEIEEYSFFNLVQRVREILEKGDLADTIKMMKKDIPDIPEGDFAQRLAAYEKALLSFRDELKLSGMTTQCWTDQEKVLRHVPCFINARLAAAGFPVACENDAYSLIAELMGQYASADSVTMLDINHSIPHDLGSPLKDYPPEDLVGLFHCGNTDPKRLVNPEMKHQVIMKRLMEPDTPPDITRGTIEGRIGASPMTMLQIQGVGDGIQAYIAQGEFLDVDPQTFGSTGTAYVPGFRRFYRHVLLGRFHHHAAVAFSHCGDVLFDSMKLLGIKQIYTPNSKNLYEGENPFC